MQQQRVVSISRKSPQHRPFKVYRRCYTLFFLFFPCWSRHPLFYPRIYVVSDAICQILSRKGAWPPSATSHSCTTSSERPFFLVFMTLFLLQVPLPCGLTCVSDLGHFLSLLTPWPCSAALAICAQTNGGDGRKVVGVGAVGGCNGRIKGEREALWGLKEDFIPEPSFGKMSKKARGDG